MSDTRLDIIIEMQNRANAKLSELEGKLNDLGNVVPKVDDKMKKMRETLKEVSVAFVATGGAMTAFFGLAVREAMKAETAQAKLRQIVQTSTGASDEQVDALIRQAKALQNVGVVSDSVTLAAQGTLATFDLKSDSIQALIPAFLNMMVAEKGMNATTEDAIGLANGLGKVLQGQVGALSKQGFIFDEATEKLLKHGTETEKVAALTQILNSTYDGLNERLRETTEGQLKGAQMAMGSLMETIGNALLPTVKQFIETLTPLIDKMSVWITENQEVFNRIVQVTAALGGLMLVLGTLGLAIVALNVPLLLVSGTFMALAYLLDATIFEIQRLAKSASESATAFNEQATALRGVSAALSETVPAYAAYATEEAKVQNLLKGSSEQLEKYIKQQGTFGESMLSLIGQESDYAKSLRESSEELGRKALEQQRRVTEMTKNASIADKAMLASRQSMTEAMSVLGKEELQERVASFKKEIDAQEDKLNIQLRNEKITQAEYTVLQKEMLETSKARLALELRNDQVATQEKMKILQSYGQYNVDMINAVAKVDGEQLNNRLQYAQQYGLNQSGLIQKLLQYNVKASNAELKAYADYLSKREQAAARMRNAVGKIFEKPILQEIRFVGDSFAQKIESRLSSIKNTASKVFNGVSTAINNYTSEVSAIQADFDSTVDKIKISGDVGADALNKLKGGGGGGGAGSKELEKLSEQAEKLQEDFKNLAGAYEDTQNSMANTALELESKHTEKMTAFRTELAKSQQAIIDLDNQYKKFVGGQGNEFGSMLVNQQLKVADLESQLSNARLTMEGEARDSKIMELSALLQKEQTALEQARNFQVQGEADMRHKIVDLEANLQETQRAMRMATDIEEQARLQVQAERIETQLGYLTEREQNFAEEQKTLAVGVERARVQASMSEMEKFLFNLQTKRVEEKKAVDEKIKQAEEEMERIRTQAKDEIAQHRRKMDNILEQQQILEFQHAEMMKRQTEVTKVEIDKQIQLYKQLAEAAKNAQSATGIQYRADGGFVERFASGGFARGTDTVPAMLTPGELVLNASQQKNLAGHVQRGSGGKTIIINIDTMVGDDEFVEKMGDKILRQLTYSTAI